MGVRFLGALQLPRARIDGMDLVELSALGYDEDEDVVYALSDQGVVFHLRVRTEGDRLAGVEPLSAHRLRDADGEVLHGSAADAEGLVLLDARNGRPGDTRLVVSFERQQRLVEYRPDGTLVRELGLPAGVDRRDFAASNRGIEALAELTDGTLVGAPEKPLRSEPDTALDIRAMDGRRWRYPLYQPRSAVVELETVDDDSVLVLERDLDLFFYRVINRLRLASGFAEQPDGGPLTVVDLASFDSGEGWRTDNFEGLTRLSGNHFLMVSDDNDNVLQRTLLVLFERLPGRDAGSGNFEPLQDAGR